MQKISFLKSRISIFFCFPFFICLVPLVPLVNSNDVFLSDFETPLKLEVSETSKDPKEVDSEETDSKATDSKATENEKEEKHEKKDDLKKEKKLSREEKNKKKAAEFHAAQLGKYGVYPDKKLQAYINEIGQKIAGQTGSDIEFTFTVVNDGYRFNAETLFGHVYITLRALHILNSEAELAFVLGHEVAHNTKNHSKRQKRTARIFDAMSQIVGVMTRSDYGSLAQDLGSKLAVRYGQNDELEADRYGAIYMSLAGYCLDGAKRGNKILKAEERFQILRAKETGQLSNISRGVRTHPPTWRRIPRLSQFIDDELAPSLGAEGGPNEICVENRETYLSVVEGTRVGDKTKFGVVRENNLYIPRHGAKFKLPQDWRFLDFELGGFLTNRSAESHTSLEVRPLSEGVNLKTFAENELKLKTRETREITISGRPAYFGIADQSGGYFRSHPARFAIIKDESSKKIFIVGGYGNKDLRKIKDDRTYISTIFSFDFMTLDDYRKATPLKIKIIKADKRTTMESLAAASPIGFNALSELRLLNGFYPAGEPRVGQLLKIVE